MPSEKMKKLNSMLNAINKKYGEGTVQKASEAQKAGKLTKRVFKTPSLELNNALYGGFTSGVVELYGPNSSGKTSLAIEEIVLQQKEDPEFVAAWMETEGSVSGDILQEHGVDMDRLIFWKQEDLGNAENAMDVARAFLTDGNIDMLVVNSVAGLAPATELKEDLSKQNIALIARMLSKFFRVALGAISRNNVLAIFINQTRDNVGVMFGNPETSTGGKALGFYASQRVRMSQVKIQASDPIKADEGVKISVIIKKNRSAGTHNPYTKCEYYAMFDRGIDSIISIPQLVQDSGIMTVKGAHWYLYDDNNNIVTIDGIEGHFSSKKDFIATLRDNEAWRNEMNARLNGKTTLQTKDEIEETKKEDEKVNEFSSMVEEESTEPLDEIFNNIHE